MKFADIYKANAEAVKEALTSLWCTETNSVAQKAYAEQLKALISDKLFADKTVSPIVQSMEKYKVVSDEKRAEAINLVGDDLWSKATKGCDYPPYIHQYDCWDILLNKKESIVVTTGTGSGKTECFMLPLVRNLLDNPLPENTNRIQAIFLYPLNALMEDQKSRMQRLLKNTPLHFAVYNGNLPERRTKYNASALDDEQKKFSQIITTRAELHHTAPDILLTNPTMLEYMLLRDKDQKLFQPGALKWIVVDEAHTFTGAGAAELAMLLRRVADAFGVDPAKDIRFAASSATIGDDSSSDLQRFIADISGVAFNKVNIITGDKQDVPEGSDKDVYDCRVMLKENDYIELDKLLPGPDSTEDKLAHLDDLCDRGVRAKVHYFYRIPNNGIMVQLDNWQDRSKGILTLLDRMPDSANATPALEIRRCKHCGEYFAAAEISATDNTYRATTSESADIFDFVNPNRVNNLRVFGVVNKDENSVPSNKFVKISGNTYITNDHPAETWEVVANDIFCCPHCGHSLLSSDNATQKPDEEESDNSSNISERDLQATPLRVSAEYIAQTLAPALLSELSDTDAERLKNGEPLDPHHGQQYISFVDSRQAAAQSTFKQNLEVERTWIYSRIYHKLCEEQDSLVTEADIEKLKAALPNDPDDPGYDDAYKRYLAAKAKVRKSFAYMTWEQIFDELSKNPESDHICKQFVNRESEDEFDNDTVNPAVKERYIFSVMLEQLSKYPPFSATAETMGLLESYYPALDGITAPDAFKEFNKEATNFIKDENLDQEWRNLLKIYLDRVARSNETLFMKLDSHPDSDIFNCSSRFGLKKPARRTARKPLVRDAEGTLPVIHLLLAKMLATEAKPMREVIRDNKDRINAVIEAMWDDLIRYHLLQYSSHIPKKINGNKVDKIYQLGTVKISDWVEDQDTDKDREKYEKIDVIEDSAGNQIHLGILDPAKRQLRLNVKELAFRLPKDISIAKVMDGDIVHYRPVTTLFNGFCPYYKGDDVVTPEETSCVDSKTPFIRGLDPETGLTVTRDQLGKWTSSNLPILYNYDLLGTDGCFTNRLFDYYSYPDIFIQAEHTAQVDKRVSRISQILFQNHKINILACSTTMEMGVDLGDLDLVVMSSIPPHPANYRQRAGRSGRNNGSRSACITLCSSDVVGLRTLYYPLDSLINRKVAKPYVDLNCPTIIQRHANAFLFRSSKLFFSNDKRSNLSLDILSCFSHYDFGKKDSNSDPTYTRTHTDYWHLYDARDPNRPTIEIYPNSASPLGPVDDTRYDLFRKWLTNTALPSSLQFLLRGTSLEGKENQVLATCLEEWEARYNELVDELSQIGKDYEAAYDEAAQSPDAAIRKKAHNLLLETGYGNKLRWEYYHSLRKKLIEYLSTHRFTPNANMPVDVVEFNVNSTKNNPSSEWNQTADNPSYQLRQAISQYAPGNSIVKENRVLIVAGVEYAGKNRDKDPLLAFYTDGKDVVSSAFKDRLQDKPVKWPFCGREELQLVQAKSFIPDINAEDTRILDKAPITRVNAQLIGAEQWNYSSGYSHLAVLRSNSKSGNAKILYYNEGIGFGYCLCGRCGKMVLETGPGTSYKDIPKEMTWSQITSKATQQVLYGHNAIDRKDDKTGLAKWCAPVGNKYYRNVILGDLIQTDFCEILIRESITSGWYQSLQNDFSPLLFTLGIVFCRVYADIIGKDRQSLDFIVMPTGHICIFDTNPGGSGYSNKFADPYMFRRVVKDSLSLLRTVKDKDAILDKFTLKYLNDIDIDQARAWLEAENETWEKNNLPDSVKNSGLNADWATLFDIISCLESGVSDCTLFIRDNWNNWNYRVHADLDNEDDTLKVRLEILRKEAARRMKNINVAVVGPKAQKIPAKLFDDALEMKGWLNGSFQSTDNILPDGLYPLAILDDKLFFTDEEDYTDANGQWARGNVFRVDYKLSKKFGFKNIDLTHRPGTHASFVLPLESAAIFAGNSTNLIKISSEQLYSIVCDFSKTNNVDMESFIRDFRSMPDRLEITYQDEHLKSALGMVVTLQFIKNVIITAGKSNNFSLTFLNEKFWDLKGTDSNPTKGMKDSEFRNDILKDYITDFYTTHGFDLCKCQWKIDTKGFKGLPHWRVLTLKCGSKQISVLPNGGFINEWSIDQLAAKKNYGSFDDMPVNENIPLFRRQEIKYDIIIDNQ